MFYDINPRFELDRVLTTKTAHEHFPQIAYSSSSLSNNKELLVAPYFEPTSETKKKAYYS